VLADCRFTVALGSAGELEGAGFGSTVSLAAKTGLQAASSAAAKTGETRAKLLGKKREEKTWPNGRETCPLHTAAPPAKFFRLNLIDNPPPQTATSLMLLVPLSRS
jgi:hypothetical protein